MTLDELVKAHEKALLALEASKGVITRQQEEIEKLSATPNGFGIFLDPGPGGTADIQTAREKVRVESAVDVSGLRRGQRVVLSETGSIVKAEGFEIRGGVGTVTECLPDGRLVVSAGADELFVVSRGGALSSEALRGSESVLVDLKAGVAFEVVARDETADLLLEEVPDITYSDVGGLARQVEQIRDAVELPVLHPDLFKRYHASAPKGVLLYGPPGCGKTLIAKAVANSLAKGRGGRAYFINVAGPELLNKYVGETERKIREIFIKARERATPDTPVIIFFDEMESMFRTRGSGVSMDVESTIVPQLLAEIDGVEESSNVIVMGATNRQDLIDPAVLRPGRLDVKIAVARPDEQGAREILGIYLTDELPYSNDVHSSWTTIGLTDAVIGRLYSEDKDSEFIEVSYQDGKRETLYFKDFISGAMIENIVNRAKLAAIKDELAGKGAGIHRDHLLEAVAAEFRETEDLPNTTNPDDWARISGRKGERIVAVRPLLKKDDEPETVASLGQYL